MRAIAVPWTGVAAVVATKKDRRNPGRATGGTWPGHRPDNHAHVAACRSSAVRPGVGVKCITSFTCRGSGWTLRYAHPKISKRCATFICGCVSGFCTMVCIRVAHNSGLSASLERLDPQRVGLALFFCLYPLANAHNPFIEMTPLLVYTQAADLPNWLTAALKAAGFGAVPVVSAGIDLVRAVCVGAPAALRRPAWCCGLTYQALTPKERARGPRPPLKPWPMALNFHSAPARYSSPKIIAVSTEPSSDRS